MSPAERGLRARERPDGLSRVRRYIFILYFYEILNIN